MFEFPPYFYAIFSALLWAISAPVLNLGLRKMHQDNQVLGAAVGLYGAMSFGIITLFPFTSDQVFSIQQLHWVVLAGVFTYPLATGLYYLTGVAFQNRIELASQFAKVKPVFSVLIAILLFGEAFTGYSYLSAALVFTGIAFFIASALRGSINASAIMLGLIAAVFWSVGELFVRLAIAGQSAIDVNFISLVGAFAVSSLIVIPLMLKNSVDLQMFKSIWPFFLHGVLSFGIAYAAFFESIRLIGLGKTVLINAFWPTLAVAIVSLVRISRGEPIGIPPFVLLGIGFILSGSIVGALEFI